MNECIDIQCIYIKLNDSIDIQCIDIKLNDYKYTVYKY